MSGRELPLRWAALYTRGLPEWVAGERLREIESDVWEHRAAAGSGLLTDLAIASRTLRGVGADLSWRRSHRSGRRLLGRATIARALGWAAALVSYVFLLVNFGWGASAVVGLGLYGDDWAPGDVQWYSRFSATVLLLLIGGALVLRRYPRAGATVMLAALAPLPLVLWWAAPLYGPLVATVGVATIVLARRRRRTIRSASRDATRE